MKSLVTKKEIATIIAKLMNISEEDVMKATSIHDVVPHSLDKVELICELEDYYSIRLNLEEAEHLSTWDQAISYLQHKVNQPNKNEK
jgi:acyl carrier protein